MASISARLACTGADRELGGQRSRKIFRTYLCLEQGNHIDLFHAAPMSMSSPPQAPNRRILNKPIEQEDEQIWHCPQCGAVAEFRR